MSKSSVPRLNMSMFDENNTKLINMSGVLDENAQLVPLVLQNGFDIIVDFGGITSINSIGIRNWLFWLKKVPPATRIYYRNCPKIIVDQINMVSGFLPRTAEVLSFYVPFKCDITNEEKSLLLTKEKDFTRGQVQIPAKVVDSKGNPMDISVSPVKYFSFITSRKN